MKRIFVLTAVVLLCATPVAYADTFGSGANSFEIEFVRIGQPGNPPDDDPNPAGAVKYEYRIGKYEVSEQMIDVANALDGLGITKDTRGPDKPATSITWFEAARFVNWLNTSTNSVPAYKFDASGNFQLWLPTDAGYDPNNLYRNRRARYFLPSVDEWQKAAYYDPVAGHYWDYPTASNAIPDGIDFVGDTDFDAVFEDGGLNPDPHDIVIVGIPSPYSTFAQGGNVIEWQETAFDRGNASPNAQRFALGGSWGYGNTLLDASNSGIGWAPSAEFAFFGLRVATVPEPSSFIQLATALMGYGLLLFRTHAFRKEH